MDTLRRHPSFACAAPAPAPNPITRRVETYEFVVPGPPVSAQANDRAARRNWQRAIQFAAMPVVPRQPPFMQPNVRLTVVFLTHGIRMDLDNLIKPIQDGLQGMFYPNDRLISDVDGHRRSFSDLTTSDVGRLPALLQRVYNAGDECVYIRLEAGRQLEELL